jgi:hypothetical protein
MFARYAIERERSIGRWSNIVRARMTRASMSRVELLNAIGDNRTDTGVGECKQRSRPPLNAVLNWLSPEPRPGGTLTNVRRANCPEPSLLPPDNP